MKNYQKVNQEKIRKKIASTHVKNQIKISSSLYKIYKIINKRLFDDCLPMSQITFYYIKNTYGEAFIDECYYEGKHYPIIVLNPEYFDKGLKHIIEILIHEMVHVYCFEYNIKEINYKTGYHNKNFKQVCDKIGLKCKKSKNGYNRVALSTKLKVKLNDIITNLLLEQLILKYNY